MENPFQLDDLWLLDATSIFGNLHVDVWQVKCAHPKWQAMEVVLDYPTRQWIYPSPPLKAYVLSQGYLSFVRLHSDSTIVSSQLVKDSHGIIPY